MRVDARACAQIGAECCGELQSALDAIEHDDALFARLCTVPQQASSASGLAVTLAGQCAGASPNRSAADADARTTIAKCRAFLSAVGEHFAQRPLDATAQFMLQFIAPCARLVTRVCGDRRWRAIDLLAAVYVVVPEGRALYGADVSLLDASRALEDGNARLSRAVSRATVGPLLGH